MKEKEKIDEINELWEEEVDEEGWGKKREIRKWKR